MDEQRYRWHSLRTNINAIFWLNETGTQWRNLDSKYPAWQSVYYHFRQFKQRGIWERILDVLVVNERIRQQRVKTQALMETNSSRAANEVLL